MLKENTNHFDTEPENHKKVLKAMGQYLKELRLAYGMTQTDFSFQQGIGKNSLQNAEYGRNVTMLTFFKIVDGLISPRELFETLHELKSNND